MSELALGRWARKKGPAQILPSISKPKFFAIPTSPALLLDFFFPLGICTILGAGFSMREPLFCTGGKLGFFRELYLVLPSLFSFLNLCKRLWWPPSSPGMPEGCHPALGHRVVESPRRRGCSSSLAWPEVRVCVLGGGRGRWGELCLPFGAW